MKKCAYSIFGRVLSVASGHRLVVGLILAAGLFACLFPAFQRPDPKPVSFGGQRTDFTIQGGYAAFVILPKGGSPSLEKTPWIWYAPTLARRTPSREHEWLFSRLLRSGFGIAGV